MTRIRDVRGELSQILRLLPLVAILALVVYGIATRRPEEAWVGRLQAYRAAVADSAVRDEGRARDDLWPITAANDALVWRTPARHELLVVSFVSTDAADLFFRSADGTGRHGSSARDKPPRMWVTLAPELQRFCRRPGTADPAGRVGQYLGLSPLKRYDRIVEMWVARDDLFRPCEDPEVTDSICSVQQPETPPIVKNIPDYQAFLQSLHEQAYQSDRGMPWTGMGYTYDWSQPHGVGASEYMLVPGATYDVRSVVRVEEYCN
jgi:hypothetical protein